jgi:hypothetical protein
MQRVMVVAGVGLALWWNSDDQHVMVSHAQRVPTTVGNWPIGAHAQAAYGTCHSTRRTITAPADVVPVQAAAPAVAEETITE